MHRSAPTLGGESTRDSIAGSLRAKQSRKTIGSNRFVKVLSKQERWSKSMAGGEIEGVIFPSGHCQNAKHLPYLAALYSPILWKALFPGSGVFCQNPGRSRNAVK
jgi:hypothetical protein